MSEPAKPWTRERLDILGEAVREADASGPLAPDEAEAMLDAARDFHKLMTSKP